MNAEDVAQIVADALTMHGYPYMGVEINPHNAIFPTIKFWDDGKEAMVVIACSSIINDALAKAFAVNFALNLVATGDAPTGAIGYPAWPDASDPDAVRIPDWAVFKKPGRIELPGQPTMDWKTQYAARDPETGMEFVIRNPNGTSWFWWAGDPETEDGAVSTLPGFDTKEEAMLAVEDWYKNEWLPKFKATGDREIG